MRLRSKCLFVPAAQNLLDIAGLGIRASDGQITNGKWSTVKTLPGSVFLYLGLVPGLLGWAYPEQLGLSSTAMDWCWAISFFHAQMGLAPSPNCECGASEQTTDHVLTACTIHRAPHGARDLTILDDKT